MSTNKLVVMKEGMAPAVNFKALLNKPVDQMEDSEIFAALSVSDLVVKALGDRTKEYKTAVKKTVAQIGASVAASTRAATLEGIEIRVTTPADKISINEIALALVLDELEISRSTVFDQVPKLNAGRLEQLIASGALTDEQIERFTESKASAQRVSVKKHIGGMTKSDLLK